MSLKGMPDEKGKVDKKTPEHGRFGGGREGFLKRGNSEKRKGRPVDQRGKEFKTYQTSRRELEKPSGGKRT